MPPKLSEVDKGNLYELLFQAEVLRRGWAVSVAHPGKTGYDCIVDTATRLFRVQVKARSVKRAADSGNRYLFGCGREHAGGVRTHRKFSSAAFDVLAAFCVEAEVWAFATSSSLAGKVAVYYSPSPIYKRATSVPWFDWSIFAPTPAHQPAHQLTGPILQPSPEL